MNSREVGTCGRKIMYLCGSIANGMIRERETTIVANNTDDNDDSDADR